MSTLNATGPLQANNLPPLVGVSIDTSRHGHDAAFLRDDLQPAADELPFAESARGYASLRQRLEHIIQRHSAVRFLIPVDAAGQYADNLLHLLHGLAGGTEASRLAQATCSISCGDPQRNKNYRAALFGSPSLRLCRRRPQRRGPCPLHRTDGRGRTFSAKLDQNVFQCFDAACG
jgi:hypothetical protein